MQLLAPLKIEPVPLQQDWPRPTTTVLDLEDLFSHYRKAIGHSTKKGAEMGTAAYLCLGIRKMELKVKIVSFCYRIE